jgi:hypothetical protein
MDRNYWARHIDAFGYRRPSRWERSLAGGALRLRGRVVRRLPPMRSLLAS